MRAVSLFTIIPAARSRARHRRNTGALGWLTALGARMRLPGLISTQSAAPRSTLRHRADDLAHAVAAVRRSSAVAANELRHRASDPRVRPLGIAAAALAGGAGLMYYLDPASGKRRRARVRDRLAHLRRLAMRDVPEKVSRRGRFLGGVAKGVRHDAGELIPHHHAHVDDETLVARVRSEVLRHERFKAGEIHIDAYEGCVTLRGQLEREGDIRGIVERTRHVEGVTEVRSYLHLPGTPPPNKAEAYGERLPAYLVR